MNPDKFTTNVSFHTLLYKCKKMYGDVGIAELQKEMKQGRGDGINKDLIDQKDL